MTVTLPRSKKGGQTKLMRMSAEVRDTVGGIQQATPQEYDCCSLCGSRGVRLYESVEDLTFGVVGQWDILRCSNEQCGLLWVVPPPLGAELEAAYRNYYTHQAGGSALNGSWVGRIKQRVKRGYLAKKYAFEPQAASVIDGVLGNVFGILLPFFREYFDIGFSQLADIQKGKLLEIGCGNGSLLQFMARWGWRSEGVDFDPKAVALARARGLNVHQADLLTCSYPDDTFDVVFSSHVIEHVPDPVAWVAESFRILKPGGRLVVITPNADAFSHVLFGRAWRGLEPPRHLHVFSPRSMKLLFNSAGNISDMRIQSSARSARRIFADSLRSCLRKRGAEGKVASLVGEVMHFIEWVFLKPFPLRGGELVCIARKKDKDECFSH